METINIRRTCFIASILALFVSYIGIWIRFINDPIERTGSDFMAFYSVGRIAQSKGFAHVYDPLLQQDIQEDLIGFPLAPSQFLISPHPPYLIPILSAITGPDYILSFYRWLFVMILFYATSIVVLSLVLRQSKMDKDSIIVTALGGLLFYPFFFSMLNGQDTAFLVLGISIWLFGLFSGKEFMAGLGLSLATIRPHIAILLALPMLFRYRRTFWGFMLGSGLLSLISYLLVGPTGIQQLINLIIISTGGEGYGLHENNMMNLVGLLFRALPGLRADTIHMIGWTVYGLTIIGLCILWAKTKDVLYACIGWTVALALFVAPHLHFHDLTLLLIPIYGIIRTDKEMGTQRTPIAIGTPIMISLLLLLSNLSPYLQYTIPYLTMLALVLYPHYLKPKIPSAVPHRS